MAQQATIAVPQGGAAGGAPPAGADQRPKWLPEKFKTPEEMAAAYSELEKKQSKGGDNNNAQIPEPTPSTGGLDMKALSQEYIQNGGKLTDATIESLAKRGIPRDVIDTYIANSQAQAGKITSELTEIAGGPEALKGLLSWASANLSPAEIEAYNQAVANPAIAKIALQGLRAQYTQVTGEDPSLLTGESVPNVSGVEAYESNAQVIAAMQDPRYQTDEAYRRQVERRMAVTNGLFTIRG